MARWLLVAGLGTVCSCRLPLLCRLRRLCPASQECVAEAESDPPGSVGRAAMIVRLQSDTSGLPGPSPGTVLASGGPALRSQSQTTGDGSLNESVSPPAAGWRSEQVPGGSGAAGTAARVPSEWTPRRGRPAHAPGGSCQWSSRLGHRSGRWPAWYALSDGSRALAGH